MFPILGVAVSVPHVLGLPEFNSDSKLKENFGRTLGEYVQNPGGFCNHTR